LLDIAGVHVVVYKYSLISNLMRALPLNFWSLMCILGRACDILVEGLIRRWKLGVSEEGVIFFADLNDLLDLVLNGVLLLMLSAVLLASHRAVHVPFLAIFVASPGNHINVAAVHHLRRVLLVVVLLLLSIHTSTLGHHVFLLAVVAALVVHLILLLIHHLMSFVVAIFATLHTLVQMHWLLLVLSRSSFFVFHLYCDR
jgi:hypothetical protein